MLKIGYINPASNASRSEFNYSWMLFKTYYEDHGAFNDRVEWVEPVYQWDHLTYEMIFDNLKDCDIVLFSNYVWNFKVNEKVRSMLDTKVITIVGGPQLNPDIIKNYTIAADPLTYGELFITNFIDQYIDPTIPEKKSFVYGYTNVYQRCDLYFRKLYKYFNDRIDFYERMILSVESTRGCPFKCSYCEWGGGTGTKVIKKSLEIFEDELRYLSQFENVYLDLADANTGMFKDRDYKLMELFVKYKMHIGDSFSILKTLDIDRKLEILKWWVDMGVSRRQISISIQSISDEARAVANRVDISRENMYDVLDKAREIQEAANTSDFCIDLELIMGMPGSTIDDFYEEFDLYHYLNYWEDIRYPYMILPATEAADPEYQRKYEIVTAPVVSKMDSNFGCDDDVQDTIYSNQVLEYETIIQCYSYTIDEYVEMTLMNKLCKELDTTWVSKYMTGRKVSHIIKQLWYGLNELPEFIAAFQLLKSSLLTAKSFDMDYMPNGYSIQDRVDEILINNQYFLESYIDGSISNIA